MLLLLPHLNIPRAYNVAFERSRGRLTSSAGTAVDFIGSGNVGRGTMRILYFIVRIVILISNRRIPTRKMKDSETRAPTSLHRVFGDIGLANDAPKRMQFIERAPEHCPSRYR